MVFAFDDPKDKLNILNHLVRTCIERHAPLKRVKLTRPMAPWMKDPVIIEAGNELNHLRKLSRESYDQSRRKLYQDYKKFYKKKIKEIKNSFLKKSLSSKNPKKVWDTVNRILTNQQKRIRHHPSDMNDYFVNLASDLTLKENKQCDFKSILQNLPDQGRNNEFKINHTTYEEINKIINGLKNDCSSGFDDIPIRYIKPVAECLISPIVEVINSSIDQKIFPQQWKTARVCPLPKTDTPTKVNDYRPISVLPVMSKIYERVILNQLCTYIE